MKGAVILIALLLPVSALAQTPQTMNQGNMQDMMQVMQKVQECMASIDQAKLQELNARVAFGGEDPADVATSYLEENGFLE